MGVPVDDNPRWVLVEPGVVVQDDHGEIGALLIYGPISAERMREFSVVQVRYILALSRIGKSWPEWIRANPPSFSEVEDAEGDLPTVPPPGLRMGKLSLPMAMRREIVEAAERLPGESATDFYGRFASMFLKLSRLTPYPTREIEKWTELSDSVIRQYVHRCRKRGLIPPAPARDLDLARRPSSSAWRRA
jgi:hypothetical protein